MDIRLSEDVARKLFEILSSGEIVELSFPYKGATVTCRMLDETMMLMTYTTVSPDVKITFSVEAG